MVMAELDTGAQCIPFRPGHRLLPEQQWSESLLVYDRITGRG